VTGSKKQLLAPRVKSLFQNSRMPKNQDKMIGLKKTWFQNSNVSIVDVFEGLKLKSIE
jgi:hypothetical protein